MKKIPKIFHHTWPSGGVFKEKFRAYRESFMRHNPDYTFMFWTSDDRREWALSETSLLMQNPGVGLHWIVASDIMRHEILYKWGGIYVDTDAECLRNFDDLLESESFAGLSYEPNSVGNGIIGTYPGNPLFKEIAEAVVTNIFKEGYKAAVACPDKVSGPNFVGKYLEGVKRIFPRGHFYPFKWDAVAQNIGQSFPGSYTIHWWSGMDADGWVNKRAQDFSNNPTGVTP